MRNRSPIISQPSVYQTCFVLDFYVGCVVGVGGGVGGVCAFPVMVSEKIGAIDAQSLPNHFQLPAY